MQRVSVSAALVARQPEHMLAVEVPRIGLHQLPVKRFGFREPAGPMKRGGVAEGQLDINPRRGPGTTLLACILPVHSGAPRDESSVIRQYAPAQEPAGPRRADSHLHFSRTPAMSTIFS